VWNREHRNYRSGGSQRNRGDVTHDSGNARPPIERRSRIP
jgi:hypothetical protein